MKSELGKQVERAAEYKFCRAPSYKIAWVGPGEGGYKDDESGLFWIPTTIIQTEAALRKPKPNQKQRDLPL